MDQQTLKLSLEAYQGKRVLVTGNTGFKGSWLCQTLLMAGAEVAGYALPPEHPHGHYEAIGLAMRMQHTDGDLRDAAALSALFASFKPEIVFHLGAQALVRRSYNDPKTTFDTNVGGSLNVLEAVRQTKSVRALVYITSDKCYRNKSWVWGYRENDELGGDDPYSASKACAELIFRSYLNSYLADRETLGVATTRAGNVIGGGDFAEDRIVPDCVRALEEGKPIELRAPQATRPWQHVLEPVGGYLHLGAKLLAHPKQFSGSWNFGPAESQAKSVLDVAKSLVQHWGTGKILADQDGTTAAQESPLLQLNCDKARNELGWQALWNFDNTMQRTAQWYRKVHDGAAADEVTTAQINDYFGGLE